MDINQWLLYFPAGVVCLSCETLMSHSKAVDGDRVSNSTHDTKTFKSKMFRFIVKLQILCFTAKPRPGAI